MKKVVSKAVVNLNTIEEYIENKVNNSQNQCTCIDTYCSCS